MNWERNVRQATWLVASLLLVLIWTVALTACAQ
jgi:hypothetical protein